MSILARPRVKQWGYVVLFGLACFAAGNYHVTREALDGSSNWWRGQVHKDLSVHLNQQRGVDWRACLNGAAAPPPPVAK